MSVNRGFYEPCWIPVKEETMQERHPLEVALELVSGDRNRDYGHPLDNHQRIADFWTVRLRDKLVPGGRIEPHEAAAMMRLVKEARLMETPGHLDSLVDLGGYVSCEYEIHREAARRAARADADVERLHETRHSWGRLASPAEHEGDRSGERQDAKDGARGACERIPEADPEDAEHEHDGHEEHGAAERGHRPV